VGPAVPMDAKLSDCFVLTVFSAKFSLRANVNIFIVLMAFNQHIYAKNECYIDHVHQVLPFGDLVDNNIKGAHVHGKLNNKILSLLVQQHLVNML
jgi:hypothetical protein